MMSVLNLGISAVRQLVTLTVLAMGIGAMTGCVQPGWLRNNGSSLNATWSTAKPLPLPRGEVGVGVLEGRIYVLGGSVAGRWDSPLNHEYDPATGQWREKAPLPRGLSHIGVAGLDGKLYAVGGFVSIVHVGAVDLAFRYDPGTDRWESIAPITTPRASVAAVALGGHLHALGGRGLDKVTVATHEIYDPKTNRWRLAAPMPIARDHMGAAVINGKIHVVGGRTANQTDNVSQHDVYDPIIDRWTPAAPLPTARSSGAAAYARGRLVYAGGECRKLDPTSKLGGGETFDETQAYDPLTDRWSTLSPMPSGRHAFGAAVIDDTIYFPSGTLGCGGQPLTAQVLTLELR